MEDNSSTWGEMPRAERYAAAMAARAKGLSGSQTAALYGTTRNAVLGAIKRGPNGASRYRKPPGMRLAVVRQLFDLAAEQGVTNTELARRSGYDEKHLSCLRQGRYNPSITSLCDLANALGYEVTLSPLKQG